jgi:nickel-dependent lactate racemase
MISILRYGADSSLRLELKSEALVAHCAAPRGEPLSDVASAVDRALAEPLDFPPLAQAALPGDSVVLALAPGVPRAAAIVARTIDVLLANGVRAQDITLLRTQADVESGAPDPLDELTGDVRSAVVDKIHDPTRRDSLSYLGASSHARPIYINRAIHDADLVIPIGCLRLEESLGYHGINSSIFPTFADAANADRYRSLGSSEAPRRQRLRKQADEVSWLLGLRFTIQVVPGAGAQILHVLAGDVQAVFREGRWRCDEAWSYGVPERASLVVATIEGDGTQQTWENVGRALAAAALTVAEPAAVAICCDLAERPPAALQQIAGADDLEEALLDIGKHKPADALAAMELVHALQRGKVYLLSRLDEDLVEELGMSPVAAEQISRLASRYDSCIVLANAQYAVARPRAERTEEQPASRPKLPR